MKKISVFSLLIVGLLFTSCEPGYRSRQVRNREEFLHRGNDYMCSTDTRAMPEPDFIALPDMNRNDEIAMNDVVRSSTISPGDPGSRVPGIESFRDPKDDPQLSAIFRTLHFPYNSSLIKGSENMDTIRAVADYMKANPNVYVFIEGHTDERGAEAFNLSLGARRSNAVRSLLVKHGVNADNSFTVSYGKERPVAFGHTEEDWYQNRRAAFKVYTK